MIHCYKLGGLNIVLDICSGSVHAVDEVAYDIINMYESNTREEITDCILNKYDVTNEDISDCFDDIEELKNQGIPVNFSTEGFCEYTEISVMLSLLRVQNQTDLS